MNGVWDFARGCMRTYLILKARAQAFDADPEVRDIVAAAHGGSGDKAWVGVPHKLAVQAVRALSLDPDQLAKRGLGYERLDQIMMEHLLGARS
jgi:xylose isomerase